MVPPATSPVHAGNQWRLLVPELFIGYIRSLRQRGCTCFPLTLKHPSWELELSSVSVLLHCVMLRKHESLRVDEGMNSGHNMVEPLLNGTRQHYCTDCLASVKFVFLFCFVLFFWFFLNLHLN